MFLSNNAHLTPARLKTMLHEDKGKRGSIFQLQESIYRSKRINHKNFNTLKNN